MRYVSDTGSVNLTNVRVQGGLPTLGVGSYQGVFIGATPDSAGNMWVSVMADKESHIECTDIDTKDLTPGQRIKFTIGTRDGAVADMQGNKYRLRIGVNYLTDWVSLPELYQHIQDNNITLAEPRLETIEGLDV